MKKLFTVVMAASAIIANLSAAPFSVADIDAVTAATVNNKCKFVLPIVTTTTTAVLNFTQNHSDGSAVISWGVAIPYSNSRAVTSQERSARKVTLTGLQPGTLYYARLEISKTGETSQAATGSFTTQAELQALSVAITQPVPVTDSSATISWTESAAFDSVVCLWGAHNVTTSVRPVSASERQAKAFILKKLYASTPYNVKLMVFKDGYAPDTASAAFITENQVTAVKSWTVAKSSPLRLTGTTLQFGAEILSADRITILDLRGRVLHTHVVGLSERSLSLADLRRAAVVMTVSRSGSLIHRSSLVIGQ